MNARWTDGVNVGYDVYRIRTRVTGGGGTIEKDLLIDPGARPAGSPTMWDSHEYSQSSRALNAPKKDIVKWKAARPRWNPFGVSGPV